MIIKIKVISNFMASQPGYQTILIHILPNILRSKGNQAVKFGQLMECNIRNIFLEKSYTKYSVGTSPRLSSEKLKLSLSLDQQSKVLCSLFLLYVKLRAIGIYWKKVGDYLFLPHIKQFWKIKRVLPGSFSA